MRVLVTAGNTQAPIDRVRCVTNVFSGRTGAAIANHGRERGHEVTLLTSQPELAGDVRYRTFEEFATLLEEHVRMTPDVVIHSAAVSDYLVDGVRTPESDSWQQPAGKMKSEHPELWLRLVRAPKLIDLIREPWGFRGVVVKFKLEVDVDDARLLDIAERSRRHSGADLMVANELSTASMFAHLGPGETGSYTKLRRDRLPAELFDAAERLHAGRQ